MNKNDNFHRLKLKDENICFHHNQDDNKMTKIFSSDVGKKLLFVSRKKIILFHA